MRMTIEERKTTTSRIKILMMNDSPERDKLMRENGIIMINRQYPDKPSSKFKDETKTSVRVKGDSDNKLKSELEIEKEIESYLIANNFEFWNMKIKGEIQSVGGGRAIMKKSKNKGFPDILCCIRGLWVGVEVKKPGGIQSAEQVQMQKRIRLAGGVYILVTSVKELDAEFKSNNLIK